MKKNKESEKKSHNAARRVVSREKRASKVCVNLRYKFSLCLDSSISSKQLVCPRKKADEKRKEKLQKNV